MGKRISAKKGKAARWLCPICRRRIWYRHLQFLYEHLYVHHYDVWKDGDLGHYPPYTSEKLTERIHDYFNGIER